VLVRVIKRSTEFMLQR